MSGDIIGTAVGLILELIQMLPDLIARLFGGHG